MRIVMIAAVTVLASSQAQASPACMTQSEARTKFPTAHLWWHGPNRCWDTTPSRTQLSKRIKPSDTRQASREALAGQEPPQEKIAQEKLGPGKIAHATIGSEKRPQNWAHESRWREAMSRMLPEDEPRVETRAQAPAQAQASSNPLPPPAPSMNWRERWIDMPASERRAAGQVGPADVAANAEPVVTPTRVMLALLAVVLTLGFVELVFRKTVPDWRR
jgi:hypothetical protein